MKKVLTLALCLAVAGGVIQQTKAETVVQGTSQNSRYIANEINKLEAQKIVLAQLLANKTRETKSFWSALGLEIGYDLGRNLIAGLTAVVTVQLATLIISPATTKTNEGVQLIGRGAAIATVITCVCLRASYEKDKVSVEDIRNGINEEIASINTRIVSLNQTAQAVDTQQ